MRTPRNSKFPPLVATGGPRPVAPGLVTLLLALGVVLGALPVAANAGGPPLEEHEGRLLLEAPSQAVAGERVRLTVLHGKIWGPEGPEVRSAGDDGAVPLDLECSDLRAECPREFRLARGDRGRGEFFVTFRTPGLHQVRVAGEAGLEAISNPILVSEVAPREMVLWGDLQSHLHTPGFGHAGALPAAEYAVYVREAITFAADVSNLDFCALTPHVQTAGGLAKPDRTGQSPWDALLAEVDAARDRSLVVIPGYEWQGNEGDHCVLLPEAGPLVAPADFRELAAEAARRGALLTAHAVYLPTEFDPWVPNLAGVEVTRDTKSTHEIGLRAIRRGLAPAFLGGSDTHGGALGATALTGVRARHRSRAGIFDAIRAARSWATNGERIVVDFEVDDTANLPRIRVHGYGTAPLEAIEIYRNAELVHRAQSFGDSLAFDHTWEDADLLQLDCVAGPAIYHAKVTQTSKNKYDPSRRDLAITSPVTFEIRPEHWDAAFAAQPGSLTNAPGAALAHIRSTWNTFRLAPQRPLRAPFPADLPDWSSAYVEGLAREIQDFRASALTDPRLQRLALDLGPIAEIARAIEAIRAAEAGEATRPAAEQLELARKAHRAAVTARAAGVQCDWERLASIWSAAGVFAERADALLRRAIAERSASTSLVRATEPVRELALPDDPRLYPLASLEVRREELRREFLERWGYTRSSSDSAWIAAHRPHRSVRVIGEGRRGPARLVTPLESTELERDLRGQTARLPMLPSALALPPTLEFENPMTVTSVFLEDENGERRRSPGRVSRFTYRPDGLAGRVSIAVEGDSVAAELVLDDVATPESHLWAGVLTSRGQETVHVLPEFARGGARLRWGRFGWEPDGAVELEGHEAARPLGLGVGPGSEAIIALASGVLVVRPEDGARKLHPWSAAAPHEAGREFCAIPWGEGRALVRGASGPRGGWAMTLDLETGEWRSVPHGPGDGTIAVHPRGGVAWLRGRTLFHRNAAGELVGQLELDRTGRLLGFDAVGHPFVVQADGSCVRLNPLTGQVVDTIEGPVLGVEPSGAVIHSLGFDARHPELALEMRLQLSFEDGSHLAVPPIPFRPLPHGRPSFFSTVAPDGSLLLLGGTTWWRRLPDHDWWGARVERWVPRWTGEERSGAGAP